MSRRFQQYSLDAAGLVLETEAEVVDLLYEIPQHAALIELLDLLRTTKDYVWGYLDSLISAENASSVPSVSLSEAVGQWREILAQKKAVNDNKVRPASNDAATYESVRESYFPTKSIIDTMMFRLNVLLQLCLERLTAMRQNLAPSQRFRPSVSIWSMAQTCTALAGVSAMISLGWPPRRDRFGLVAMASTSAVCMAASQYMGASWWMSRKIYNSAHALALWNDKWVQYWGYNKVARPRHVVATLESSGDAMVAIHSKNESLNQNSPPSVDRLHRYQSSLRMSEGEMRFLLMKKFMDIFYASVGAASDMGQAQDWQLHLGTAAAATFYSLTGASAKAVEVTSTSKSARQLLEKAWGMVSLPMIKNLSLQTFRLSKGAAVADRIHIGGIPCFILSREAVPELAILLKQQQRRIGGSKRVVHRLSTIDEKREHTHQSSSSLSQKFAKGDYRQRDVILHLTGGGFFAHIIASDLPYLLDWSQATGSVIVCPEYSLLPDNRFPAALQDVENVYQELKSPNIVNTLGFEVDRIILTGESVGGNLAAALCVKLEMDLFHRSFASNESLSDIMSDESETEFETHSASQDDSAVTRCLPHAILLSCPVLDLTNESHSSQSFSEGDPVLSTGLVSAISDAYVPDGIRSNISLISPLYAADEYLENFPSTLIFASSNDPVLNDAVAFNQRLNNLGVSSELRAVENLPHAYLGLGTAGFPEARQVQAEIQKWLVLQLQRPT